MHLNSKFPGPSSESSLPNLLLFPTPGQQVRNCTVLLDSSLFLGETGEQPAGHVIPLSDSFLTHFPLFHFTITSLAQNRIALLSKPFLTHLPALNSGPFPICVPYCHQLYLEAKLNDLGLKPLLPSLLFGVLDVAFLTVVSWCSPTLTLQALMNICHSFKSKKTLYTSLILLLLFPLPKMPFHLFSSWRTHDQNRGPAHQSPAPGRIICHLCSSARYALCLCVTPLEYTSLNSTDISLL